MADDASNVLTDLASPEEEVRRNALIALTQGRDVRALPDLRLIESSDESPELRFLARKAILFLAGALPPGQERRASMRAPKLDDPDPERRNQGIYARAARGKPDDLKSLEERVPVEEDPTVRATLALSLGAAGGKPQIAVLEKLLDDPIPDVRAAALEGLVLLRDAAAYPYFVRSARELDNRLRTIALRSLARLGRANVLRLCQAMCKSSQEWMAFSGAHLLAGLRDPAYLPLFVELARHPSADVRAKAREGIEGLGEEGNEQARAALARLVPDRPLTPSGRVELKSRKIPLPDLGPEGLRDADPTVRLKHIQLIENRKDALHVAALVARLPLETDPRVLSYLVAAVGRLSDPSCVEELEPLLDSKNDRVRANAVESIARLVPPEDRKRLFRCLSDPHHRVRTNAVLALWGHGYGGVREALMELRKSTDKRCRLSAIYAIRQIGEAASSILHGLLQDADPEVAERARECFRMIGMEDTVDGPAPASAAATTVSGDRKQVTGAVNGPREGPSRKELEASRDQALRALAEAYMERVGKELTAPPDICRLMADVTQARAKLKHTKPETRLALNQRLEILGRGLFQGSVWAEGPAESLLQNIATLDAAVAAAPPDPGSSGAGRRTVVLVALLIVLVLIAVALYLTLGFG